MSAPWVPDLVPPTGPGTITALIAFLAMLPPEAGLTDWAASTEGDGWARLTVTVLFPLPDEGRRS